MSCECNSFDNALHQVFNFLLLIAIQKLNELIIIHSHINSGERNNYEPFLGIFIFQNVR
jgi:hypothetical protein